MTPKPVCIHAVAPSFWAWKDGEASLLVSPCFALQDQTWASDPVAALLQLLPQW